MLRLHEDRDHFRSALNFTEAETTFASRLVEKDYYCTVLLEYLAGQAAQLVFKGGTCLAKVHANFFRLSEDLDFVIPVPRSVTRVGRRKLVAPVKKAFVELVEAVPCFRNKTPLDGANNSTQYVGSVSYSSLVTGQDETIKIEVALREPLLTPSMIGQARTAVLNPVTTQALVPPVAIGCISKVEAFAEKFRAALSRREVAARDFFDLDYAVRKLELRANNAELIGMVRQKLAVPGNEPVNVSDQRLTELRQQVESQLRPVLRREDFAAFAVDRAFQIVVGMAASVKG